MKYNIIHKKEITRKRSEEKKILTLHYPIYLKEPMDLKSFIANIRKMAINEFNISKDSLEKVYYHSTERNNMLNENDIDNIAAKNDLFILRDLKKINNVLFEKIYNTIFLTNPNIILVLITDTAIIDHKFDSDLKSSLSMICKYSIDKDDSSFKYLNEDKKILKVLKSITNSNKDIFKFLSQTSDRNLKREYRDNFTIDEMMLYNSKTNCIFITNESLKREANINILNKYKPGLLPTIGESVFLTRQLMLSYFDTVSEKNVSISLAPYSRLEIESIDYSEGALEFINNEVIIQMNVIYHGHPTYGSIKFRTRLNLFDYISNTFGSLNINKLVGEEFKLYERCYHSILYKSKSDIINQDIAFIALDSPFISYSDSKYLKIKEDSLVVIIVDRLTAVHELYSAIACLEQDYENILVTVTYEC